MMPANFFCKFGSQSMKRKLVQKLWNYAKQSCEKFYKMKTILGWKLRKKIFRTLFLFSLVESTKFCIRLILSSFYRIFLFELEKCVVWTSFISMIPSFIVYFLTYTIDFLTQHNFTIDFLGWIGKIFVALNFIWDVRLLCGCFKNGTRTQFNIENCFKENLSSYWHTLH